jgi:hypothetical protein
MGYFITRSLNQLALIFSIVTSLFLTSLLLPPGGTPGLIVWGVLFAIIYLGIAKFFDKWL